MTSVLTWAILCLAAAPSVKVVDEDTKTPLHKASVRFYDPANMDAKPVLVSETDEHGIVQAPATGRYRIVVDAYGHRDHNDVHDIDEQGVEISLRDTPTFLCQQYVTHEWVLVRRGNRCVWMCCRVCKSVCTCPMCGRCFTATPRPSAGQTGNNAVKRSVHSVAGRPQH